MSVNQEPLTTSSTIASLERAMELANLRLNEAQERVRFRFCAEEMNAYETMLQTALMAERELAAARGEEFLIPLEFPAVWDKGTPKPCLLQSEQKAFLTFFLTKDRFDWEKSTFVPIQDQADPSQRNIAVVDFRRCVVAKMGDPNDEVHHGHSWNGKGLDSYTAQRVVNSRWIDEIQTINRVHQCFDPDFWKTLNHYVLWFHDSTFECIAQSFHVTFPEKSFSEILIDLCGQLVHP
jgi:hypothetical protein